MQSEYKFKPKMLGIVCNWCCYGGADLAGVSRFQYPPYIKLMRVMCSGRVEMGHIFRAFLRGADGMFVGGCHINDCHYITEGNYDAMGMVYMCKKLLSHIGVNPDRLRLEWVSAGEGVKFANVMNEFAAQIEELGPLGKPEGLSEAALRFNLNSVIRLLPYIKVVERQRLRVPVRTEEAYHEFFQSAEFDRLFNETILKHLATNRLVSLLQQNPQTTKELAAALEMPPSEISGHLSRAVSHRLVRYDESLKCYALA